MAVNTKDLKIGSLIKMTSHPIMVLDDTDPLMIKTNYLKIDASHPMLVLDVREGVDVIHGKITRKVHTVYCIRLLVMVDAAKFWIVVSSTSNTGAIYLPDDLKQSFRITDKIEIVETE